MRTMRRGSMPGWTYIGYATVGSVRSGNGSSTGVCFPHHGVVAFHAFPSSSSKDYYAQLGRHKCEHVAPASIAQGFESLAWFTRLRMHCREKQTSEKLHRLHAVVC